MTIELSYLLKEIDGIIVTSKYSSMYYKKYYIFPNGSKIINPEFKKYFEFINYNNIYL